MVGRLSGKVSRAGSLSLIGRGSLSRTRSLSGRQALKQDLSGRISRIDSLGLSLSLADRVSDKISRAGSLRQDVSFSGRCSLSLAGSLFLG